MADTVNTTAKYEFANNLELKLQSNKAVLWDTCEEQDCTSAEKETVKDLIGDTDPEEADERFADLKETDPGHDRVWIVKPNELYFNKFVDGSDQLATKISLDGGYTMAAMATINRAQDSRVLEGAYGPIISGKDGTVSTPFPAGQIIPVTTGAAAGATGMNVAKLILAGQTLDQSFVDQEEERFMVIDAVQNAQLLSEVPATSADFKGAYGGTFVKGRIMSLLGWNFVHMELRNPRLRAFKLGLTVDANGYTKNPFWTRSGIRKGVWRKLRTAIKDQPQKVDTRSVFAGTTVAATRTQAGKVGIILNSEQQ